MSKLDIHLLSALSLGCGHEVVGSEKHVSILYLHLNPALSLGCGQEVAWLLKMSSTDDPFLSSI